MVQSAPQRLGHGAYKGCVYAGVHPLFGRKSLEVIVHMRQQDCRARGTLRDTLPQSVYQSFELAPGVSSQHRGLDDGKSTKVERSMPSRSRLVEGNWGITSSSSSLSLSGLSSSSRSWGRCAARTNLEACTLPTEGSLESGLVAMTLREFGETCQCPGNRRRA